MVVLDRSRRLKKELSLLSVFALATGTTLSAGFFLLPTYAAIHAGPALILSYVIAAVLLVPAMLSIAELATAMPRAGGAYYFLDRSLGPLAGTVGGLGTWLALVLKTAFALVGMGAYLALLFDQIATTFPAIDWIRDWLNFRTIAAVLAVLFGVLNIMGAQKTGRFQMLLVFALLAILAVFIGGGTPRIETKHFQDFFGEGVESIIATAGLVFISYVGLTNLASVSEEVKDPERNLPLGLFLALGTAVVVYVLGTIVMVGVLGAKGLEAVDPPTPVAAAAETFGGSWLVALVSVGALLAFASVANAGILSASRYPLAMARDHLVPRRLGALSRRRTPVLSILLTVGAILLFLLLPDPESLAKLASAFQLLMFGLLCLAVIVMRQSGIESYDPGFRSPFYPWVQIFGMVAPIGVIAVMGWLPMLFSVGLIVVGVAWYVWYARSRVKREGAIYHVFERLGRRRFDPLDRELRGILQEKGLREHDPFDEVVAHGHTIDATAEQSFEDLVRAASQRLAERLPCTADTLFEGFMQGTRIGATPVAGGTALPHLRLPDVSIPHVALVRSRDGVTIATGDVFGEQAAHHVSAIFFLVSPDDDPGQHLRLLAELAGQVDREGFLDEWLAADDEHELKKILLRNDRYTSIVVARGAPSETLIDQPLRDVSIPEGCLVAVIRRAGQTTVPTGSTVVRDGDLLTIIGSAKAIREANDLYAG